MSETVLESVLRRDRAIIYIAVAVVTLLAWAHLLWLANGMIIMAGPSATMPGMDMPGMNMPGMDMPEMNDRDEGIGTMAPSLAQWSAGDAVFMFTMWAVMMIGMMTPSAAPMILIYARVGRQAAQMGKPLASASWFAMGYLAAWIGFAFLATGAQWALESTALLTPMMASASPIFGGLVLIVTGLYQWTPLKDTCLSQCQSPLSFIQRHGGFRREARGAFTIGMKHGAYCIGCCWALMILLFVGGVMNLLWIAAIALFVLAEKVIPAGRIISRIAGGGAVAAGIVMLIRFWGGTP